MSQSVSSHTRLTLAVSRKGPSLSRPGSGDARVGRRGRVTAAVSSWLGLRTRHSDARLPSIKSPFVRLGAVVRCTPATSVAGSTGVTTASTQWRPRQNTTALSGKPCAADSGVKEQQGLDSTGSIAL